MSTHTPGPWQTIEVGEFTSHLAVANSDGVSILTVVDEEGVKFGAVFNDGDADLIAAAPDILDALKGLLAVAPAKAPAAGLIVGIEDKHAHAIKAARAAIAKAEGVQS